METEISNDLRMALQDEGATKREEDFGGHGQSEEGSRALTLYPPVVLSATLFYIYCRSKGQGVSIRLRVINETVPREEECTYFPLSLSDKLLTTVIDARLPQQPSPRPRPSLRQTCR